MGWSSADECNEVDSDRTDAEVELFGSVTDGAIWPVAAGVTDERSQGDRIGVDDPIVVNAEGGVAGGLDHEVGRLLESTSTQSTGMPVNRVVSSVSG